MENLNSDMVSRSASLFWISSLPFYKWSNIVPIVSQQGHTVISIYVDRNKHIVSIYLYPYTDMKKFHN